jgi:hypothetical protein
LKNIYEGGRFAVFWPRDVRVCVRRMEGRSVRSTERSEARNVPTLRSRGTPKVL